MDPEEKRLRILEIAADTRKFEIGLFWSRSLFFWGFSTVAITAYGAAYKFAPLYVQFAVACAGLVCSFIWALVNRSSKYWQKIWEEKAANASFNVVGGNLFAPSPSRQPLTACDFPWWNAHFSVSKLATAFSDFTALVWLGLAFESTAYKALLPSSYLTLIVGICTLGYLAYTVRVCRPDPPTNNRSSQHGNA